MNSTTKKTAVIIGSGFAGMSAAVFLDTLGFKVTVLERKPILGGRTYAFKDKKTTSWVDNGQHLLMGAYFETFRFLEMIGAKRHLKFQKQTHVPLVLQNGTHTSLSMPNWAYPFNVLRDLWYFSGLSFMDKWNLRKIHKDLGKIKKNPKWRINLTVTQWLTQLGQSPTAQKNFWDILTLATLNDSPQVASADALAIVLSKGLLASNFESRLVLPKASLSELMATPAKTYLEMRGHKVITGQKAIRLHVLDHRVRSIECEDGTHFKADVYLSAVPFRQLLRIVPEGFIANTPYFRNLGNLKTSPIVSVNLWFDRDFIPHEFIGAAHTNLHWFFNRNKIADFREPPFHYVGVISGAHHMLDWAAEKIKQMALDDLAQIFPESQHAKLIHYLVNKERDATLSPTVESENDRPMQKSPFENFYVIGDWTKTGYPATIESAVVSASLAVNDIAKSLV